MSELIGRYDPPWSFSDGGITHSVYSAGSGVPVVVLHELPGMVEECLDLGLILSKHFRVHLPLLFGEPGKYSVMGSLLRICISREIHLFSTNGPGPLLDWTRALCRKLKAEAGVRGVGVIGMCLTGGFALARAAALGPKCVLGLRYAGDRIAPAERIETIRNLIGPAFDYEELPGNDHATLTVHRQQRALERTIAFLQQRLA